MCPQTPTSRKCLVTVVALKRERRPRIAHLKKSLTKKGNIKKKPWCGKQASVDLGTPCCKKCSQRPQRISKPVK